LVELGKIAGEINKGLLDIWGMTGGDEAILSVTANTGWTVQYVE